MTYLAAFTLASPLLLWLFFILLFYVLAGKTPWLSYPFWIVGAVIDVFVNVLWGTILFWQWPSINRLFLSARMDDLLRNGTGWRKSLSLFIVEKFLQPYDKTKQHTTYGESYVNNK